MQQVRLFFTAISAWVRRHPLLAGIIAAVSVLFFLVVIWQGWGYQWGWTGLGPIFEKPVNTDGLSGMVGVTQYVPSKTLWDWLQLLAIPVVVAVATYLLNREQAARDATREDSRKKDEADREARREQDAVVDAYLNQIANLLLHEDLGKPNSADERARQVARAQTLTALRRVDGRRKGTVMGFLSDSDLINLLDLHGADLSGADLEEANLKGEVNLEGANLEGANLRWASLDGAWLRDANLRGAHMIRVSLERAHLEGLIWRVPSC